KIGEPRPRGDNRNAAGLQSSVDLTRTSIAVRKEQDAEVSDAVREGAIREVQLLARHLLEGDLCRVLRPLEPLAAKVHHFLRRVDGGHGGESGAFGGAALGDFLGYNSWATGIVEEVCVGG